MRRCLACAALLAMSTFASAQPFPSKPIRVIVPYEPGGAVDLAARDITPKMSEDLGQPIVVENRGGAGGQIGAQQVAKAAPDGYTFMFTVGTTHALSRFATKDLPYDPVRDFTPIASPADTVLCIAARPGMPANTLKELLDYAKRNPGTVSYGTTAVGGSTHLAMEEIARLGGVSWTHIPFKGGGPITVNLVGNQLDLGALPVAPVIKNVQAGKMKILAIFGPQRFAGLPEVGTVKEALPQYEDLQGGIWALGPAGLPKAIVERLNASIGKAVTDPSTRARLEGRGQIVQTLSADEFAAAFAKASQLAAEMVKRSGIRTN